MKNFLILTLISTIGFVTTIAFGQDAPARVPDHYIVQVRQNAQPAAVAGRHGLAPGFVYNRAMNGFAGFVPPGRVAALAADPDVLSISPDHIVTAIGRGVEAAGKASGGTTTPAPQVLPAGVQRVGSADAQRGFGIGVAIVDTGIDLAHADLSPLGSASFNAFRAGAAGQDDNGHGTHVAGTVAARDNSIDVVGVAPDATVYAVKVLNSRGSGTDSTIIAGLNWVLNNATGVSPDIRVVNMSLGRAASTSDGPLHTAVKNVVAANITVVVAAGNDCGREISQMVPAGFPEVIAVASTTAKAGVNSYSGFSGQIGADTASYFTTDGAGVTISAPGEDQEDISKGGFLKSIGILSTKMGGGTTRMSGTSMASPHVAGAVARLLGRALTSLTPQQVRDLLQRTADSVSEAPRDGVTSCYTFDGVREGILSATALDTVALPAL